MSDANIDPAATSAGAATALAAGKWTLDPDNSRAEFAVKHFWGLITVRGHFNEIAGELSIDPAGAVAGELESMPPASTPGTSSAISICAQRLLRGREAPAGRFQALRRAAGRRFGARDGRAPHDRRARGAPHS